MNQIRLAFRACILAGLAAATLALGRFRRPRGRRQLRRGRPRTGRVPERRSPAQPVRACP